MDNTVGPLFREIMDFSPFFSCILIVADSFLLTEASKITWQLSLFCFSLSRTQNIGAVKLSLPGEMCVS